MFRTSSHRFFFSDVDDDDEEIDDEYSSELDMLGKKPVPKNHG